MNFFKTLKKSIFNYSHRDKGIMCADSDDAKMEQAIKSARESLPEFLSYLSNPGSDMENFAVKVGLKTKDNSLEHCWVSDLIYKDDLFKGKLSVEPNDVAEYQLGSEITINMDEISDWAYSIKGKYYGHYTTKCLLPEMPEEMRKYVMEVYGWDNQMPINEECERRTKMNDDDERNPILDAAFGLFETVAPGSLSDPVTAYKTLVDTMGWVIIKQTENLSTEQLKELKEREPFEDKNLIQIKKMLESESCKIGPEPKEMATGLTIPSFNLIGIEAEFVPLNDEEKQNMLNEIEIPD